MSELPHPLEPAIRVLMVSYEFPPLGGGTGNACRHLLGEFRDEADLRIELVTSGTGSRLETDVLGEAVRIHRVPVTKKSVHFWTMAELAQWTWRAMNVSRRMARETDFALCHCWSGWPSGWIGYLLRRRLPYIVALRGSDVPGYNSRLRYLDPLVFRHLSRRVWRRASAVTSVSEHLKSLARRTADDLPIDVIGNGVDTTLFSPGPAPEAFSVLFVGRLIERKRVDLLLRAFRDLGARNERCRLVIVGDGPERQALEELCRGAGLDGQVSFRGVLSTSEIRSVYRSSSVFVMPAVQEGMSNAVLEAMAAGLPVIMTDTGGSDVIRGNGMIVEAGDDESLRAAIARYMEDPNRVRRHGEASRRLAESMSWKNVARAYREIYRRIADAAPRRGAALAAVNRRS